MSTVRQAREALGARLRELRQAAGLNGKQLAEAAGWQATKISKIEHGKQTPSEADLRIWARICDAETHLPSLIAQLRSLELAYAEWRRQLRAGTVMRQRRIGELEAQAQLLRWFEPSTVPGLLQTPEYARSILSQVIEVHGVPADLDEGVRARMDRQAVLYRPGHRFHFILTEAAIRYRGCPVEVLMGQIERLIASATLPSVALGVIPFTALLRKSPVHAFVIYDQALVTVETFAAELSLIQPEEIALYGKIFDLMHRSAVYGRQARTILTRVLDELAESNPSNSEQSH